MIEHNHKAVGVKRQCQLLNVARSTMYYKQESSESNDSQVLNEIYEIYQATPFYGYRRILVALRQRGLIINHKKLQRILKEAGIHALYPSKKTSIRNLSHKIYPYLLKDLVINRPNQVWATDITYIKIHHGFVYLVCLIDLFSRKIVGWSLSTFLDAESCLEAFRNALKIDTPEIINSDQGCQFTSTAWTTELLNNGILISMDGKGRWVDNVYVERLWRTIKYEAVYLHSFNSVTEARTELGDFIDFYNNKRFHQVLNYHTPSFVYNTGKIPTKQDLFVSFMQSKESKMEVAMVS